jgi:hypothetical protein
MLYPPLSYFGPFSLASEDHYLGSLLQYRFRIDSNQILCTINVYIKAMFGRKNKFIYFVYYKYLESEKAKPLSDPR